MRALSAAQDGTEGKDGQFQPAANFLWSEVSELKHTPTKRIIWFCRTPCIIHKQLKATFLLHLWSYFFPISFYVVSTFNSLSVRAFFVELSLIDRKGMGCSSVLFLISWLGKEIHKFIKGRSSVRHSIPSVINTISYIQCLLVESNSGPQNLGMVKNQQEI